MNILEVCRNSHEPTDHLEIEPFDVTHGSDMIPPRPSLTVDGLTKVDDLMDGNNGALSLAY